MRDLRFRFIPFSKTKLYVQLLNVRDLRTETPYLFSKSIKVIHTLRIAHLGSFRIGDRSLLSRVIAFNAAYCQNGYDLHLS